MPFRPRVSVATLVAGASVAATCALVAAGATSAHPPRVLHRPLTAAAQQARPNVFMVTIDDAAPGDFRYMPHVRRLVGDQGVTLTNAVASTPVCVPSRASLLTGQYAHNHGARTISGPHGGFRSFDDRNTLPVWLRRAGYDTLFVGKYLNGYGAGTPDTYVPPGWSQWRATVDPSTYNFMAPRVNVNGRVTAFHRYSSYVIRDQVNDLLGAPARRHHPWYLWANYVAPHTGGPREPDDPRDFDTTVPAPPDRNSRADLPLPRKPDMFHRAAGGRSRYDRTERREIREVYEQRIESLHAIDRAVASHVARLKRTGQWRDTVVIVSSDNGYAVGEHNIVGKLWFYKEISNLPTVIRGPGVPVGRRVATVVSTEDLAVSIAHLAGARPGRVVDGSDVWPLLRRPTVLRAVPLEGWNVADGNNLLYTGVRYGGRWTYYRYTHTHKQGLFDHTTDPYELHNLVGTTDPRTRSVLQHVRLLDREFRSCAGSGCPAR